MPSRSRIQAIEVGGAAASSGSGPRTVSMGIGKPPWADLAWLRNT